MPCRCLRCENLLFPQLADELWVRLGHVGWTVKEVVHDNERHPCELIEELSGADVLLTAHGFQVSSVERFELTYVERTECREVGDESLRERSILSVFAWSSIERTVGRGFMGGGRSRSAAPRTCVQETKRRYA